MREGQMNSFGRFLEDLTELACKVLRPEYLFMVTCVEVEAYIISSDGEVFF
jgi:hypothetical protein